MAGMLRIRRTRGAASGTLLALLGIWGAVIPFIGPYFHYAYTPDTTWTYTTARLWLEILPGAAVFLGGVLLIIAAGRHIALTGAFVAAAGGAWFALGTLLSPLWSTGHVTLGGTPVATTTLTRVVEEIGFFTGLGVAVVLVAGMALGRISSVAAGIREVDIVAPVITTPTATEADTVLTRVGRHEETHTTA